MKLKIEDGILKYLNERNQEIGFIREECYISKRDNKKNQIFNNPRYKNALAIDLDVLEDLKKRGILFVKIRVINFEKENFWAIIKVNDFLEKGEQFSYDKRNKEGQNYTGFSVQVRQPLHCFVREYGNQLKLGGKQQNRVGF